MAWTGNQVKTNITIIIINWSHLNKLTINKSKTKEIIFWKSGKVSKNLNIPTIPQIERVHHTRAHIDYALAVASQRFYLLNQLKKMSLATSGLNSVFSALIVSPILYALPAFYMASFCKVMLIQLMPCLGRPKHGGSLLMNLTWTFSPLYLTLDCLKLSNSINIACTICSLKFMKYLLRGRPTSYEIPRAKISKLLNSFIYVC